MNGSIKVESQVNGVTQSVKTGVLEISNLTATIMENNRSYTYRRFSKQYQANASRELEFHKQVQSYTTNATITISGTMICKDLKINTTFSKTFSGDDLIKANRKCPYHTGCDFRITDSEVSNIITHDVIFKTETGGYINNGTSDISYTNIIDNSDFPTVPSVKAAGKNYSFAGWFDESGKIVTNFPKTVTKDYVFIAKWNEEVIPSPTPVVTPSATPVVTPSTTPVVTPSTTPVVTPSTTPVVTPSTTPVVTPSATPVVTPSATPANKTHVTPKPKHPTSKYVPVTGESDIIVYVFVAFLISGIGLIVFLRYKKKH